MTVGDLIKKLQQYPRDLEVSFGLNEYDEFEAGVCVETMAVDIKDAVLREVAENENFDLVVVRDDDNDMPDDAETRVILLMEPR